jgi:hypothetical protein
MNSIASDCCRLDQAVRRMGSRITPLLCDARLLNAILHR